MVDRTHTLTRVQESLDELLGLLGRDALRELWFRPIEPDELGYHLAQCFSLSTYLPFATQSSEFLAVHLWPGRRLLDSPIVLVSTENLKARFIASSIESLPAAMTVQVSEYFSDIEDLTRAADGLASSLSRRRRPSKELKAWLAGREECSALWWYAAADERARRAWQLADVGHPFAGFPALRREAGPTDVLGDLESFVAEQDNCPPEVLSVLEATRREAELPTEQSVVLRILASEAWLGFEHLASGWWRRHGEVVAEWDCTLQNIDDPQSVLGGTPFEPLIAHPGAYSGEPGGTWALRQVAARLREQGDLAGALRQLRNVLLLHSLGYADLEGDEPAERGADDDRSAWAAVLGEVVEISAALDRDGLATALARELPALVSEGP